MGEDDGRLAQSFSRLMLKWKASLYKVIFRELAAFLCCFWIISLVYQVALNPSQQRVFERLSNYADNFTEQIPVTFILGFYVTIGMTRWWTLYMTLPKMDKMTLVVNLYIPGENEENGLIRRTLLRHTHLMYLFLLREISPVMRKRYPRLEDLVKKGYMTASEQAALKGCTDYWVPATWAINLLSHSVKTGIIDDSEGIYNIATEILKIRDNCNVMWRYNWLSIPLAYTQSVTMATYVYFAACLFGRQRVGNPASFKDAPIDIYFPMLTVYQFLLDVGLLKVVEQLLHPYGEDDNDFDLVYLNDKNNRAMFLGSTVWSKIRPHLEDILPKDMDHSEIIRITRCTSIKTVETPLAEEVKVPGSMG